MGLKLCETQKKLSYPTQRMAIRVAIKRSKSGTPLRVYRHSCGFWHLTSSPKNDNDSNKEAS